LFLYGRVISTDANPLGVGGAILIYIYLTRSRDKSAVPELIPEHLLVPPMMTNKRPWTMGYFEFIENRPLGHSNRLPQHCFVRSWRTNTYFDERGEQIPDPIEPIGIWGLHSYQTIDDEVSKALGIPLAPEE
jgi:hypothetical protein